MTDVCPQCPMQTISYFHLDQEKSHSELPKSTERTTKRDSRSRTALTDIGHEPRGTGTWLEIQPSKHGMSLMTACKTAFNSMNALIVFSQEATQWNSTHNCPHQALPSPMKTIIIPLFRQAPGAEVGKFESGETQEKEEHPSLVLPFLTCETHDLSQSQWTRVRCLAEEKSQVRAEKKSGYHVLVWASSPVKLEMCLKYL